MNRIKLFYAGIFIFLLLQFFPTSLNAQFRAEELLWSCTGIAENGAALTVGKFYCLGYIAGLLDTHALFNHLSPNTNLFCLPEKGVSNDQATKIFIKYLKNNPKDMHQPARIILPIALKSIFPCKEIN